MAMIDTVVGFPSEPVFEKVRSLFLDVVSRPLIPSCMAWHPAWHQVLEPIDLTKTLPCGDGDSDRAPQRERCLMWLADRRRISPFLTRAPDLGQVVVLRMQVGGQAPDLVALTARRMIGKGIGDASPPSFVPFPCPAWQMDDEVLDVEYMELSGRLATHAPTPRQVASNIAPTDQDIHIIPFAPLNHYSPVPAAPSLPSSLTRLSCLLSYGRIQGR